MTENTEIAGLEVSVYASTFLQSSKLFQDLLKKAQEYALLL
jgi:hypothetical protein